VEACHRTTAEKGDLWHWKAARSAPYRHADDAGLTWRATRPGPIAKIRTKKRCGQRRDVKNETPDGSRPLYMQDPARKPSAPGFLLVEEAVPIADYSIFKAGDVIPYRLPVKPGGSRFDVKAESRHADGLWRSCCTENSTPVRRTMSSSTRKRFSFAIAVFDDTGADHSQDHAQPGVVFKR